MDVTNPCCFDQAVAASIEAIFILLSESNMTLLQDPIPLDKLHELLATPITWILGLILYLHCMTIGTPPEFIAETINLLKKSGANTAAPFRLRKQRNSQEN